MAKDIRYPSATGVWEPGESLVFDLTIDSPADVWLYRNSSFSSSASILNGLQSGGVKGSSRTSVAVDAGIWPSTGAFVPDPPDGDSLHLVGDPGDPANWISGAPTLGDPNPPAISLTITSINANGMISLEWVGGVGPFIVRETLSVDPTTPAHRPAADDSGTRQAPHRIVTPRMSFFGGCAKNPFLGRGGL